jgi:ribonuclease T1
MDSTLAGTGFRKGFFMWRNVGRKRQGEAHRPVRGIRPMLTAVLMAWLLGSGTNLVQARGPLPDSSADVAGNRLETISAPQLPPQGQNMLTLIRQGGPFRHDKDGAVFGNRERILPAEARGYYREYTVRTPWDRSRGARRIVCGGRQPAAPEACFYTDDHYASFRRIFE